jgi:predicted O-methyltransferase YrrM
MALSGQNAKVYSFEDVLKQLQLLKKIWQNWALIMFQSSKGTSTIRFKVVSKLSSLDFIFVDANHRKAPTLSYFEICLPKVHENSIMIFDDIYWSKEMTEAWEQIKQHPSVGISIDLFQFGIVLLEKHKPNSILC